MYNVNETEHQELFYLNVNPCEPIDIHIPSALGPLGYYIFVRVPAESARLLVGVSSRFDIDGLHEDHLTVAPGENAGDTCLYTAKEPGWVWYCLGRARVSRGNGTVVFHDWPAAISAVDLLLCTWPRFLTSGQADDWIAAQQQPGWAPSGVPLGGIGGGRVDICRDGRFRNFSMNNNQDAPLEDPAGLPGAYLAVSLGARTVDLATSPIIAGHEACTELRYTPRFPQAMMAAPRLFEGIDVTVTLSGTLIPHDVARSSIPGFLVRWACSNTGADTQTVTCRMGWPNLIGVGGRVAGWESGIGYGDGYYHHWDDPSGRQETCYVRPTFAAVCYSGAPAAELLSSFGAHHLGVRAADGLSVAPSCGDGVGEVAAQVTIAPGETAMVTMALVTAMPHWVDSYSIDRGMYWQQRYASGEAMLQQLLSTADEVISEAGALAALFAESTLPAWLCSRLCNCNYPLVTNSVLYADGRFSINEGPTEMAGCYGTIDQRLAAHPATSLFYPQLNATELRLFAAIQAENGGIQHDLGSGHLEHEPGEKNWPDLTCSFVIQTAKHAWMTGDAAFEQAMWPRARRALLRHAQWADAGHGVAQVGHGLGTSYDGYHYVGTTGYMATLWLASLAVGERWAARMGDTDLLEKIPSWRQAAQQRLDADLWNGEYYIAYGNDAGVRRETCHAGQLAGQVYARLLAGIDVIPAERVDACIDAVMTLNGATRFAIPPDEVAADGAAAVAFGWLPYLEGFMLSAAATREDARLLPLWQRMIEVVEADGKTPCDTRLMYRPEGGEPSWGTYYMTAPASWLVYEALLDFRYLPEEGLLRLRATLPGRYPLIHPLFWAMADVGDNGEVTVTIKRIFSEAPLVVKALEVAAGYSVTMDDAALSMQAGEGDYRHYTLSEDRLLFTGATLKWQVTSEE